MAEINDDDLIKNVLGFESGKEGREKTRYSPTSITNIVISCHAKGQTTRRAQPNGTKWFETCRLISVKLICNFQLIPIPLCKLLKQPHPGALPINQVVLLAS